MIEVKNIKKSYGTLQVLKGIDLIIPEKQIVTIVGASGAGKSTLLHMPAWIKGVPRKEAEKKALGLLELMGLQDRISHKPSELSGGEQQRVSVARALINSPKVVLADEPSGNLDTHTKNELHQLFFSLRDELGQTFVIVTHDTELAEMSDSKICLSDGQIKG